MSKLPKAKLNKTYKVVKHSYSNKILARSISSRLTFNQLTFFNTNWRGVRLRKSKFKNCKFVLSDFYGAIFNKGKFENVTFKKCVFYATIFRDTKFINCTFDQCFFINMRDITLSNNCHKYNFYELDIPLEAQIDLLPYKTLKLFQVNRLLHIKGGKINKASIFIVQHFFSYNDFLHRLNIAHNNGVLKKIFSTFKLIEVLQDIRL